MSDVVVLRALGLGDLLTSVAALRGLRRAFPGDRLVLAAPAALGSWLASQGVVDDVIAVRGLQDGPLLSSRAGSPEVAVDLHGSGPASHELLRGLSPTRLVAYACEPAGVLDGPLWRSDDHEVDRWIRLARWAGGSAEPADLRLEPPEPRERHVVVHPGAASGSRRWPAPRWAVVAGALAAAGRQVVVTGTAAERELCEAVAGAAPGVEDLCGRLDLSDLGRVVGTAALVLSGDTGVSHVATAFGTPSVTLFGPVSPALWGPRVDPHLHAVIWPATGDDLRPGDAHGAEPDARLLAIGVPEVLEAAGDLLATRTA